MELRLAATVRRRQAGPSCNGDTVSPVTLIWASPPSFTSYRWTQLVFDSDRVSVLLIRHDSMCPIVNHNRMYPWIRPTSPPWNIFDDYYKSGRVDQLCGFSEFSPITCRPRGSGTLTFPNMRVSPRDAQRLLADHVRERDWVRLCSGWLTTRRRSRSVCERLGSSGKNVWIH